MRKRFGVFTLASNGMDVAINMDNIAFAYRTTDKDSAGNDVEFTRVFMKELLMDESSKWVDVKEMPQQIADK